MSDTFYEEEQVSLTFFCGSAEMQKLYSSKRPTRMQITISGHATEHGHAYVDISWEAALKMRKALDKALKERGIR